MPDRDRALLVRGAGPIGQAVARRLAGQGFDVAVTYGQDAEGAEQAAETARELGAQALTLPGRVGDPMAARNLVDQTVRELGGLEALVVCPRARDLVPKAASPSPQEAFASLDVGDLEAVLQADLKGPFVVLGAAVDHMLEASGGGAVLVGTDGRLRAGAGGTHARLAAGGLAELVDAAGPALAPEVTVNGVRPGPIVPSGEDPPEAEAGPELVSPPEVAEVVVHLLQAPVGLTGQVVDLGGPPRGEPERGGSDPVADRLPGIEQRVEPPDPDERIDLE